MKKVIIVGAGAQGNVICGILAKAPEVSEIMLVDLDIERASEVAEYINSDKIQVETADASDKSQLAALFAKGGYDLVVNATLMTFNRQIIEAALESESHYIDMASDEFLPEKNGKQYLVEQLEYAEEFEAKGLTANILAGGDSGLVNVMAKEAVDELDEVDYIGIKDYGVVTCDEPVAMWSFQTYLEDCADKAIYWENGQYKWAEPFSGEEEYYFPAPLNLTGKVFYHNHEEPLTIPKFIGKPVKYVDFKMGDPDSATWEFLLGGLKLMDTTPVDIKGNSVSPKEVFCNRLPKTLTPEKCIELVKENKINSQAVLAVDVKGTKAGKKLHYKMWTDSPNIEKACSLIPGTNDVSWITSVPASVLSLMILRGQIKRTGVFPCEVFNKEERDIFFKGIKEWDVIIHKQITSDIA
ncbi:MAG: saccharopine dehydrogenase NADP-binding domain-containing protein [Deltaproteobacteria bacterium]|nr:saccharopine dehydrogenase NADP-binding domain-containing protein [Deltaproteobacteria bacterium]